MTVVIAPGTGVNDGVTVLLSQVALPSPTLDQVRSGQVIRLLQLVTRLTGVSGTRNSDHCTRPDRDRQSDDDVKLAKHVD